VYFLHCTEVISVERIKNKGKEEIEMEEIGLGILCPYVSGKIFRTQMQT
jgi:hypothetical protein